MPHLPDAPIATMRTAMACAVALTALSACGGPEHPPPEAEPPPREEQPIANDDQAHVLGAWDVVSFEGYAPETRLIGATRAAYADFDAEGVRLRMECNYTSRPGTLQAGRFQASADADHMQTLMGCGPEGNAREARYFAFFEQNPSIEGLGPHRLLLEAGGQTLVLERPEVRRRDFTPTQGALTGTWQLQDISVSGGGTGLSELPGHLVFTDGTLRHTACRDLRLTYRIDDSGRFVATGDVPSDLAARCPALHLRSPAPGLPSADDAIAVLSASPMAEFSGKDGLLLSTEEFGLFLSRRD